MERLATITATQTIDDRSLMFCKWLSCLYLSRGAKTSASELFLQRWPMRDADLVTKCVGRFMTKAAVAAGTTTDPNWAGALVQDRLAEAFFEVVKRASLLSRIPGLRHIPLYAKVPTLATDANYYWSGEGQLKAPSRFSFSDGVTLRSTKMQGTVVVTNEVAKLVIPGTEGVMRDYLVNGITGFTDRQFVDPTVTAIPDTRPGSITNGLTPIAGTGDVAADIATLVEALYAGRAETESVVVILPPGAAAQLKPTEVGVGVTIVTSPAAVGLAVALDPRAVFVADIGIELDSSYEALLEMDDAPTGGATAVLTSTFQNNLAAFRVERFANWERLPNAVQYLTLSGRR